MEEPSIQEKLSLNKHKILIFIAYFFIGISAARGQLHHGIELGYSANFYNYQETPFKSIG